MARYAALLSAVNVGGRKVPMAQLRELLDGLGYTAVKTYLASGNAVFTVPAGGGPGGGSAASGTGTEAELAARISDALRTCLGFAVPVVVRDSAYLRQVIAQCPFPADEIEGRQLHAVFYAEPVAEERYADIDRAAFVPEEFRLGDRVMYLHLPGGMGRSPLAAALAKPAGRLKGLVATGRNWNTVKALAELTAAE
jgi:uncharacterized protein (DUF1697 family)